MTSDLEKIKLEHLADLKNQLDKIERPDLKKASLITSELKRIQEIIDAKSKEANSKFVSQLNKPELEQGYSDEERLKCYEVFRKECEIILNSYVSELSRIR